MAKWSRTIPAPDMGAYPDAAPRAIPPNSAARLTNWLTDVGFIRSRPGTASIGNNPNSSYYAVDIHNVAFGTGAVETFYHNRVQSYRFNGTSWASVTGLTWTGSVDNRFWAVLAPFSTDASGRILINNGVDAIRTYDTGGSVVSLGSNAKPAKYAIVGEDGRLITANTVESSTQHRQRVRWTIIGLTASDHTNWSNTGSGAIDLRNDRFEITGLFKLGGRIFVGKTKGLCYLVPTGITTDAYGYETFASGRDAGADGIFIPTSLVQFGEVVGFISHRTALLFDGSRFVDILGRKARKSLFSRINTAALSRVTSVVDADNNRIGWGLPLDGATVPNEIWWYDIDHDAWSMDVFGHTALSIFTNVDTTTVDELTGDVTSLGSAQVDTLSATEAPAAKIIAGISSGTTELFSSDAVSDNGRDIVQIYESPALTFESVAPPGSPTRYASPHNRMILDEVALWLHDYGTTYTVQVAASGDGGRTWMTFGTVTMTTGDGATADMHRCVEVRLQGRLDVGKQCQIQVKNNTPSVPWGLQELTATVDVAGKQQVGIALGSRAAYRAGGK